MAKSIDLASLEDIADLNDVDTTNLASGELLRWDGTSSFVPTTTTEDGSGNLDVSGTITDSLNKNVRSPKHTSTSASLEITEAGVYTITGAHTITFGTASSQLVAGDIVVLYNQHTATVSIQDGDFTAFYIDEETTHRASVNLAAASMATVIVLSSTKAIIAGAGVSAP